MNGIMALLAKLSQAVTARELRQLRVIVPAVLAMTGPVTMLNIVRWSGKGGSYPTVRRFYPASIVWLKVKWALSREQLQEVGGFFAGWR